MIQENKELLLKYLCMSLPYGVKVFCGEDWAMTLKQIDYKCFCECWENEDLKCNSRWMLPYLRPMSSMSDEEKEEFESLWDEGFGEALDAQLNGQNDLEVKTLEVTASYKSIQWLLKNHFDFMGLIPKNLAIEVTKDNNPYEK